MDNYDQPDADQTDASEKQVVELTGDLSVIRRTIPSEDGSGFSVEHKVVFKKDSNAALIDALFAHAGLVKNGAINFKIGRIEMVVPNDPLLISLRQEVALLKSSNDALKQDLADAGLAVARAKTDAADEIQAATEAGTAEAQKYKDIIRNLNDVQNGDDPRRGRIVREGLADAVRNMDA